MSQPEWKFVDNLGDVNAIDHGGLFLYEDATGQYPAELEKLERNSDADDATFTIHRVTLGRCKEESSDDADGRTHTVYLVPFNYESSWPHPLPDYEEWFVKDLGKVAAFVDTEVLTLRKQLCSDDSKERAKAYQAIYDYHRWADGDSYPLTLTIDEVEDRYSHDEVDKRDPIDRLRDAIEAEHVISCGNGNTCDIHKAFECELYLWAGHLLAGATECPRTGKSFAMIAPTETQLQSERSELLGESHMACPECNATVWTDENKVVCDNCAVDVQRRIKIENSDSGDVECPAVIVTIRGPGAVQWAKTQQQSLCGSSWESDGDMAYVIIDDGLTVIDDIRDEVGADVEIDDSEYCGP